MKFNFVIIVYFILYSTTLTAQDEVNSSSQQAWTSTQFGLKLGYVNSNVYGSQVDRYVRSSDNFNSRNGVSLGLQTKVSLLKWWYAKFEVNLIQKGAEMEESNFIYPPKPYFTYLNIPVITGLRIDVVPNVMRIGFEVGLASNIEISNQENLDKGLYPTIYPSYDKYLLDINYGLEFEFRLNEKISLSTGVRIFKDLDAFFQRIDHYQFDSSNEDQIEFNVSEMKHKGWGLNFGLNYSFNN